MAPTAFDITSVLMLYDLAGRHRVGNFSHDEIIWDDVDVLGDIQYNVLE
jgi:hypothetical protein